MKPYERRKTGAYPYFKLAVWDDRSQCWRDGKHAYPALDEAKAAATEPGTYRPSMIEEGGRQDLGAFDVPLPPPSPGSSRERILQ